MLKEQNILIADFLSTSRLGLKTLCNRAFPNSRVYEVSSLNDLYQMLRSVKKIDLLLLELFLGRNSTLSAMSEIMRFHPDINILVISTASGNIYANRVLNEGAKGFINNSEDSKLIEKAIRMVSEGDYFVSQEIYIHSLCKAEKKTKGKNPFDVLSNKEIDIVHYLLKGMSTSEISDQARLAVSTVSTYKMRIFQKLQVNNLISLSELAATYEVV